MGRDERLRLAGVGGLVRPDGKPLAGFPRVALGYSFGTLHYPFVKSLQQLREYDFDRMRRGLEITVRHFIPQSGLYIDHNRNRVVEKFLTTNAEWLVQIDTDVEFPPDLVETLVGLCGSERKILAASVPLGPPLPNCGWFRTKDPGIWAAAKPDELTEQGIEVHGIATAVCIIHREVFEAIANKEGQTWFFKSLVPRIDEASAASRAAWLGDGPVRDREYVSLGEDLAFSLRASDVGYKLYVAKVKGLRHYKTVPLSHDYVCVDGFPISREKLENGPETPAAPAELVEVRG